VGAKQSVIVIFTGQGAFGFTKVVDRWSQSTAKDSLSRVSLDHIKHNFVNDFHCNWRMIENFIFEKDFTSFMLSETDEYDRFLATVYGC